MSADNWTQCPKCNRAAAAAIADRRAKADAAYGKTSVEEWRALDEAARLIPAPETEFREDYEIGVYGEHLEISYSGHCRKCGFSVGFKHDAQVDGLDQ